MNSSTRSPAAAIAEVNLRHATPAFRTYSGPAALGALRKELDRTGRKRVALLISPALVELHADALGPLREALDGIGVGEFSDVQEHSPLPAVMAARDFLSETAADAVVAVGGGSVVVTARASSILLAENKDVRDICTRREDGRLISPRLDAPKLPQWVVPSTPTTAYAKAGAAVRDPDTGERLALFDPKVRAQGIVVDGLLARTAPISLMRSASLNALSLSVEGLRHEGVDPLADALLAQALRMVLAALPALSASPDDAHPRIQLILASLLAGQGSDFVPGGLAQGLSHAIGPRSQVANGTVEAMLLPATTRHFSPAPAGFPLLAHVLGSPSSRPEDVAKTLEITLSELDLPARLRDVGVDEAGLSEVVDHAMDDWVIGAGPNPPTRDDLTRLVRSAW